MRLISSGREGMVVRFTMKNDMNGGKEVAGEER